MKKLLFLVILFLGLLSSPGFSRSLPCDVLSSINFVSCKGDVCAVNTTFILNNPFGISRSCVIEYHFVDSVGLSIVSFQTEVFILRANEEKVLEQVVMIDKARFDTVKEIKAFVKYLSPGFRGRGFGYGRGINPRSL